MRDLVLRSKETGGLEMILPGFYFDILNKIRENIEDVDKGFVEYHKAMEDFKHQ